MIIEKDVSMTEFTKKQTNKAIAIIVYCQKRHAEMMKTEPSEAASNEAITATHRAGEFALYFAARIRQGAKS